MNEIENELNDADKAGDITSIKRTLLAGADIHADDDVALRLAANNGHKNVVDRLLKAGADVQVDNCQSLEMHLFSAWFRFVYILTIFFTVKYKSI